MLPRFIVKTRDGRVDREMEFATSEWKPGDRIHQGHEPDWTVVEVLPGGSDGGLPILIVE